MNYQTVLLELLMGGFFAVACVRCCAPALPTDKLHLGNLFRLPGRIERLRRSRWQWFSMVLLLLAVRLQQGLPVILEFIVLFQFVLFLALPVSAEATGRAQSKMK